MKQIIRLLIAVLFMTTSVNTFAQTTATEYNKEVNALADELKTKLDNVQRSNNRNATWSAAEHALEDLKNVKKFYLNPNYLSLNWDIETTRDGRTSEVIEVRPYEKPSHREPNYKEQFLVRVINKDGKGLYIMGNQSNFSPKKYYETSTITFYDPSGRKIKCRGRLLPFEELKNLMKSSQCEVLYSRESTPGINVLNSGKNRPQGASYSNWPYAWLLKSSYTNEVVKLPFGTFWTSTPSDSGYKCITVDVMAASDYEETVLNKSDEAIGTYAFEIDYTQLLNWYKESLDYLMRDVNRLLGEQENKKAVQESAFGEADKKEPLGMLLLETASAIKSDKALFDYVITETSTTYEVNIIANTNTIRFAKEFWNKLKQLNTPNGNISLYYFGQQGGGHYNYNVAASENENNSHIRDLLNKIVDNSKSSINVFVKNYFRGIGQDGLTIQNCNNFRIHGVNGDSRYGDKGVDIPCLDLYMEKGSVLYSVSISKDKVSLLNNTKDSGYKVKVKK